MDRYLMPLHLSACQVDGRHIFLDLDRDRYFRLSNADEGAFAALLQQDATAALPGLDALARAGVLTTDPGGKPVGLTNHPLADDSLVERLEADAISPSLRLRDLVEVAVLSAAARRTVVRRRLPGAFARIAALRGDDARRHDLASRDQLIARFLAARPFAPTPAKCLHDTLALSRFLARRSMFPRIVIGVKLHPFGAHCWLQDGTTVLNDTLACPRDHQPILVI